MSIPMPSSCLFERFVSEERREPPDIDVDFEHERREEVIQYIYARYGRDRAGLAATVITYRGRSSLREVGKVMGLSEDVTAALAGLVWGYGQEGQTARQFREKGLDPEDPLLIRGARSGARARRLSAPSFPARRRFRADQGPLSETVPIGNAAMADRTVIEWDKDDIDTLGIMKVDVLGLGMLTCIRKCFDLIEAWYGLNYSLATLPREDPAVYDMLCAANSIGVFQVESRAQMNMLPRLKPRSFYDLVIEVAIVRPGPIQGDMVHPYLRRRDGLEPENYPAPHPDCGPADELKAGARPDQRRAAVPGTGDAPGHGRRQVQPGELNELRRAMATFRRSGTIGRLEEKMVGRMVARGYDPDFARRCFSQIRGFGEYGFPESHAASFAHLVYVSSWLKCHYPAVFAAALLNSQPMGFYAPAQIVRDAREHGVEVRHPDVNWSGWDSGSSSGKGCRPWMTVPARPFAWACAKWWGWAKTTAGRSQPRQGPSPPSPSFSTGRGFHLLPLEKLAAADAFRSLGLDRRAALWQVKGLAKTRPLPLFEAARPEGEGAQLPSPCRRCRSASTWSMTTRPSAVPQRPSHGFPARQLQSEGVVDNLRLKQACRRLRVGRRRRAGAPAPGHRQGGGVHNARG